MINSEDVRLIIENYIRETHEILVQAKPTDGLFGLGDDPRRNPCHANFYNRLKESLTECEDPYECTKLLFEADSSFPCSDLARAMLTAIQGLALPLIPQLTDAQRDELRKWYDENIPRRRRLPIQQDLYKALKKQ